MDWLRDAGGPVTRFTLGPRWLMAPLVLATSPGAIRDILSIKDDSVDKTTSVFVEMRRILGANLADLPYEPWLSRRRTLQPVFTKQRVREFGGHMAQAAETVCEQWPTGSEVDLDAEARKLSLRALGRSVLGIDLDQRADEVDQPLRVALKYAMGRAVHPVRAPRWLPTPAARRARAASAKLHRLAREILLACRADPTRVAPLVHALIAARDPVTGESLTDEEICEELIIFLFAGHDTIATTLTYALWALGRHPRVPRPCRRRSRQTSGSPTDGRRYSTAELHRPGAAGVASAVPSGAYRNAHGAPGHRSGRLPGTGGHDAGIRQDGRATRPGTVGCSVEV